MSLKKHALKGILWTFIQQMSSQSISFIVSIILARLLLPEEFGLIALLGIFIALGDVLINSGLTQSLIRTDNPDNADYSTVFYFNIIISIIIYLILFLSAPFIASFYSQPLLIDITRVYCLIFIINAFSIIQNTRLAKELDFKKQTIITIPSLLIGSSTGIVMAINGFGVWSLVWSAISRSLALTIQFWWWSPWIPTFNIKMDKIKYHLNFGYKLTIAGIIDTLFKDIYTIIIGKFFDPIQVGFYNRANTLRQFPVKNLTAILNAVSFPLFSKIQHDDIQLKNAYKKIMQMSIFLIAPTLLFMAVLAEPLFRFLLTDKWLPAVPYFQVLCFIGILQPISSYNLNILNVKGRSDLFLKLEFIKKTFAIFIIIFSFQWGIYGLLFGHVFLSFTGFLLNSYYSGNFINYKTIEQLKDITPTIFLACFASVIIFLVDNLLESLHNTDFIRILVGCIVGSFIFLLLSNLFKLSSLKELKIIIINRKIRDSTHE